MTDAFYVYIMELKDGRLYVGHTSEPLRRHQEHLRGHACRTSRIFKAGKVLYVEEHPDRPRAAKREAQIKKWTHAKKLALIEGNIDNLKHLSKRHNA